MAIIDLGITAAHFTQPFKGAGGAVDPGTFLPEGLTWFTVALNNILAKSAGDETHILVTMTFPNQYAYILKEFHVSVRLTLGVTNNFSAFGAIRIANGFEIAPSNLVQNLSIVNQGISFEFVPSVAADPMRVYELGEPFKQLMVAPEGQEITWVIQLADEAAGATNAGLLRMSACFYRYGLEQALSAALNAPQPMLPM